MLVNQGPTKPTKSEDCGPSASVFPKGAIFTAIRQKRAPSACAPWSLRPGFCNICLGVRAQSQELARLSSSAPGSFTDSPFQPAICCNSVIVMVPTPGCRKGGSTDLTMMNPARGFGTWISVVLCAYPSVSQKLNGVAWFGLKSLANSLVVPPGNSFVPIPLIWKCARGWLWQGLWPQPAFPKEWSLRNSPTRIFHELACRISTRRDRTWHILSCLNWGQVWRLKPRHLAALLAMLIPRPARAGKNIIVLYKFWDLISSLSLSNL